MYKATSASYIISISSALLISISVQKIYTYQLLANTPTLYMFVLYWNCTFYLMMGWV